VLEAFGIINVDLGLFGGRKGLHLWLVDRPTLMRKKMHVGFIALFIIYIYVVCVATLLISEQKKNAPVEEQNDLFVC
jgi:hypothetical protein